MSKKSLRGGVWPFDIFQDPEVPKEGIITKAKANIKKIKNTIKAKFRKKPESQKPESMDPVSGNMMMPPPDNIMPPPPPNMDINMMPPNPPENMYPVSDNMTPPPERNKYPVSDNMMPPPQIGYAAGGKRRTRRKSRSNKKKGKSRKRR